MKTAQILIIGTSFLSTVLLAAEPQRRHLFNADLLDGLDSSEFWKIRGNAHTTAGHFLGTTDDQPVDFRVNSQRALRLEPNADFAPNVIGGSLFNLVDSGIAGGTIGGGGGMVSDIQYTNRVGGHFGTVGGGLGNVSSGLAATVAGGTANSSLAGFATVGGGASNFSDGEGATVSGGSFNSGNGSYATIGGGEINTVRGWYGTAGGGQGNWVSGQWATIAGGNQNFSTAASATIGGGYYNVNDGTGATISGGSGNRCTGFGATVSGGDGNSSFASDATVGGGQFNMSSGEAAVVGGGHYNFSTNRFATVPGGRVNFAGGVSSFAAGQGAQALHDGTFVWADTAGLPPEIHLTAFGSVCDNEFAVRATGGVRFVSAIATNGTPTAGVNLPPGSGAWASLSDRAAKENFVAADVSQILKKVAALPLSTWNYKTQDKSIRHLGPTAQDFKGAFGLGENERTITTVDADGVALAAIQGMNQKLEDQMKEKEARIQALQARVERLERILRSISDRER